MVLLQYKKWTEHQRNEKDQCFVQMLAKMFIIIIICLKSEHLTDIMNSAVCLERGKYGRIIQVIESYLANIKEFLIAIMLFSDSCPIHITPEEMKLYVKRDGILTMTKKTNLK